MSDIIEEARRIVASARHYETIGGKFDGDDLENTAAIIDRLAAELEKAREACEQGKQRAQNYLAGLRSSPDTRDGQTLILDGMIQSLQFDFMQALGEEISPAAALAAKGSK